MARKNKSPKQPTCLRLLGKNICGSTSDRLTPFVEQITCKQCKQLLKRLVTK